MQPLKAEAEGPFLFAFGARAKVAAVPVDHPPARRLRHRLFGLERIIDDDEVGSPSRERAADGGGVTAAAGGGDELGAGILCGARGWKEGSIPGRIDHHAELAMQLGGELLGVAHHDDAPGWVECGGPRPRGGGESGWFWEGAR